MLVQSVSITDLFREDIGGKNTDDDLILIVNVRCHIKTFETFMSIHHNRNMYRNIKQRFLSYVNVWLVPLGCVLECDDLPNTHGFSALCKFNVSIHNAQMYSKFIVQNLCLFQ